MASKPYLIIIFVLLLNLSIQYAFLQLALSSSDLAQQAIPRAVPELAPQGPVSQPEEQEPESEDGIPQPEEQEPESEDGIPQPEEQEPESESVHETSCTHVDVEEHIINTGNSFYGVPLDRFYDCFGPPANCYYIEPANDDDNSDNNDFGQAHVTANDKVRIEIPSGFTGTMKFNVLYVGCAAG